MMQAVYNDEVTGESLFMARKVLSVACPVFSMVYPAFFMVYPVFFMVYPELSMVCPELSSSGGKNQTMFCCYGWVCCGT